jgi:glycosyltransferase involved in cell wall biosynthesis
MNPAVWLMMIAERTAYRYADAVVAVNAGARATMEKRGLLKSKFHVIPNGVSLEDIEMRDDLSKDVRERLPPRGAFSVGYAGSLSCVYGLEFLIEAARLLEKENIHFLLAGGGADQKFLRRRAAGLKNITFLGWVPKRELFAFLRQLDVAFAGLLDLSCFSIGSDSTKVFEYMKAQLPVIHAIGGENSVIGTAGAGLHVAPENAAAIAGAIVQLRALSADERRALGCAGFAYLRRHRTYEVLGRDWVRVLQF